MTTEKNALKIDKKIEHFVVNGLKCNNCVAQTEDSEQITTSTSSSSDMVQESGGEVLEAFDTNMNQLSNQAIQNWEESKLNSITKLIDSRRRHPRRYGFKPNPHFLNGFGPWNLHPGDRFSVQRKRSMSAVRVRRQPSNSNLCLSISKRLLTATISCEVFHIDRKEKNNGNLNKLTLPHEPLVYFWTPEYWYRPQTAQQAYVEFIQYISKLRSNIEKSNKMKRMVRKPKWLRRKKKNDFKKLYDNSINFSRIGSTDNVNRGDVDCYMSAVQYIRQMMKSPISMRALDFDSTCLAYELTMIDKDLFLKIQPYELESWTSYRNSRNIPNISTLIAFSHRICNLIASEILQENHIKVRAKTIVRFINVANKCERIKNFHSCISVLNGLQCASIYRLHATWAYVRKYYSMKYLLFETLCRLYNDPRLPKYQESFASSLKSGAPYLPSISDILSRLMGRVLIFEQHNRKNDCNRLLQSNIVEYTKTIAKRKHKRKSIHTITNQKTYGTQNKLINFISNKVLKNKSTKKENLYNQTTKPGNQLIFPSSDDNDAIQNTVTFLKQCQRAATKYALSTDVLAREYLLKARYQEDKNNFYNSFNLEAKL